MTRKSSRKNKSNKKWFPLILFWPSRKKKVPTPISGHEALSEIDELLKASIVTFNRTEELKQSVKRDLSAYTS